MGPDVARWARRFWQALGHEPPPPRDLTPLVPQVLPLAVVHLPRLGVAEAIAWMAHRGVPLPSLGPERSLRGCLVAWRGRGLLLVDAADPPAEQRFTVAHEVAHFLLEYLWLRERAVRRLGPAVLEVLDGLRAPAPWERVEAMLAGLPLGPKVHLMERPGCPETLGAERRADALALELLAPKDRVRPFLPEGSPFGQQVKAVRRALEEVFGLPPGPADRYARRLVWHWTGGPSVREWLGLCPNP